MRPVGKRVLNWGDEKTSLKEGAVLVEVVVVAVVVVVVEDGGRGGGRGRARGKARPTAGGRGRPMAGEGVNKLTVEILFFALDRAIEGGLTVLGLLLLLVADLGKPLGPIFNRDRSRTIPLGSLQLQHFFLF